MDTFVIVAFVVTVAISAMGTYTKIHPPDASELGAQRLRIGLRLGMISSATILLTFLILAYVSAAQHIPKLLFILFGLAGNIFNLMGIVDCLREVNGQALFAALLLVFSQLLWIVFMVPAMLG
jgi:hypothetical protein